MFAAGLAGVDADYRGRSPLSGKPEAAGWDLAGRGAGRFQQGHGAASIAGHAVQPLWLERGDHKIGSQQNGGGLRKNQPKSFHRRKL